MSGWTILTIRGLYSEKYEPAKYDEKSPSKANSDLIVTLQADDRVRDVGYWKGHVYASLSTGRYDWETGERILAQYQDMIYDAVIIGANDTSDIGEARYYPVYDTFSGSASNYTDRYVETQSEDGCHVGAIAASVMTTRHGIVAQETLRFRATSSWDGGIMDYQEEKGEVRI